MYIYIYDYIHNSTLYTHVKIISMQVPLMPIHIAICICSSLRTISIIYIS